MVSSADLLQNAAEEMNIICGENEEKDNWAGRVIYSAIGRMAYASLWDNSDDQAGLSKVYFDSRIKSLCERWSDTFPEAVFNAKILSEEYCDVISDQYLHTGIINNLPYRIWPSRELICSGRKFNLIRSPKLSRSVYYSGLGAYSDHINNDELPGIYEVYGIDQHHISEYAEHYLKKAVFHKMQYEGYTEYLRLRPPFKYGYWKTEIDKSGIISLLRIKSEYEGGDCLVSEIPCWLTENHMYRELSVSLLDKYASLPVIEYERDGAIVFVHQKYLLPPKELYLLLLYSWPQVLSNINSRFNRVMSLECFEEIKAVLIGKGYCFKEL